MISPDEGLYNERPSLTVVVSWNSELRNRRPYRELSDRCWDMSYSRPGETHRVHVDSSAILGTVLLEPLKGHCRRLSVVEEFEAGRLGKMISARFVRVDRLAEHFGNPYSSPPDPGHGLTRWFT